ncbi:MAG: hypothetical protein ACQESC_03045 [Nanobdellota archaeon]
MVRQSYLIFVLVASFILVAGISMAQSPNPTYDPSIACDQQSSFSTLVCGATPNSLQGYGAVDICGRCYPCGADDGVCPEDFFSEGVRTSCKNCPDPDCKTNNTVRVNVTVNGDPAPFDAEVTAIYPFSQVVLGTTNSSSHIESEVRSGLIKFRAEYSDFDSQVTRAFIPRGGHNTTVVDLSQGSCFSDCTGSFHEICKADCLGVNNCSFPSFTTDDYPYLSQNYSSTTIANRCDYKTVGDKVFLEENSTHQISVVCCGGSLVSEKKVQLDLSTNLGSSENAIKHLAHHVVPVKYDGRVYDMVVSSWK